MRENWETQKWFSFAFFLYISYWLFFQPLKPVGYNPEILLCYEMLAIIEKHGHPLCQKRFDHQAQTDWLLFREAFILNLDNTVTW